MNGHQHVELRILAIDPLRNENESETKEFHVDCESLRLDVVP
jgi:hypothetical protein